MDPVPLISANKKYIKKHNGVNKKCSKLVNFSNEKEMKKNKHRFPNKARATIYIGRIPHGFYEYEMKDYFSQFGKVHSTFLARSKKTGRSKGYGFVEFDDEEVAKIAAETMNNYLMYNKILKCRYIPPEERKRKIFVRPLYPVLPRVKNRAESSRNKENAFIALDQDSYHKKALKKINKFKKFFEEKGINFAFNFTFPNAEDGQTKTSTDVESESLTSHCSKSEDGTDDQFGVLEIDESDNDIQFKTPPQVKKVIKRSCGTAASPVLTSDNTKEENQRKDTKKISKGISSKFGKKPKSGEKSLVKSFKPKEKQNKKPKSSQKNIGTMMKPKKGKKKKNETVRRLTGKK